MKFSPCNILLVEDDPNDQFLIQHAFKTLAIAGTMQIVSNVAEALRYLKGEAPFNDRLRSPFPSMLITDLKLPLTDGFELLEQIRRHGNWSIVPMIVLSSSSDRNDVRKAYAAGATSFFVKPANPTALRELLQSLCTYWRQAEVPDIDENGFVAATSEIGKLGTQRSLRAA